MAWFRPPKWYTLHKLNNRTHRKILVVDGRVGFTGGVGIAEEWTGNGEEPGTGATPTSGSRARPPATCSAASSTTGPRRPAVHPVRPPTTCPDIDGFDDGVQVQVTRSTAEKGAPTPSTCSTPPSPAPGSGSGSTTAYFAPRRAFVDALCEAVGRGVDVRVLTNGPHIDKRSSARPGTR